MHFHYFSAVYFERSLLEEWEQLLMFIKYKYNAVTLSPRSTENEHKFNTSDSQYEDFILVHIT